MANGFSYFPEFGGMSGFDIDPFQSSPFPETMAGPSNPLWDLAGTAVSTLLGRIPLPGGAGRMPLPGGVGGAVGRVAGAAGRAIKGPYGKIFATLTAAGLTVDQITQLIASGAVKPQRRRQGISAAQLTGFNRVCSLLNRVGMVPARSRRKCGPKRKVCK